MREKVITVDMLKEAKKKPLEERIEDAEIALASVACFMIMDDDPELAGKTLLEIADYSIEVWNARDN